jgi:hypothetical protein
LFVFWRVCLQCLHGFRHSRHCHLLSKCCKIWYCVTALEIMFCLRWQGPAQAQNFRDSLQQLT